MMIRFSAEIPASLFTTSAVPLDPQHTKLTNPREPQCRNQGGPLCSEAQQKTHMLYDQSSRLPLYEGVVFVSPTLDWESTTVV